jgi:hypothetical protein
MEYVFCMNGISTHARSQTFINLAESNDITTPAQLQKTMAFQKFSLERLEKS